MNIADIVGVGVILAFSVVGFYIGTVRAFGILLGCIMAFQVAAGFVDRGMGTYAAIFVGVTAGIAIIGFLVYGATRFHPIDSMEGVFGIVLGFCGGWGVARFIFHTYFLFQPDAPFTQAIYSSMVGMDIYHISPIQMFLQQKAVKNLTDPNI